MGLLAAPTFPQQLSDVMFHAVKFLQFTVHVPFQCLAQTAILLHCALLVLFILGFRLGSRFRLGSS